MLTLITRSFRYLFKVACFTCSLARVRWAEGFSGPEELVDFAISAGGGLIRPTQVRSEIVRFVALLAEEPPRYVLEIGTRSGGTLFLLAQAARPDALVISVDLPPRGPGGGYRSWRVPLYKSFGLPGRRILLVRGDSHEEATLRVVEAALEGRQLDLLFIDGDHRYEGVRKDFEMYRPLVRRGGLIGFHDIVPPGSADNRGASELWKEVKLRHQGVEIIENCAQMGYGIGVLRRE